MRLLRPVAILMAVLGLPRPLAAQDWLVLQGILEGEVWKSDSGSRLLTRNQGHPGIAGRAHLWVGVAPLSQFQVIGMFEGQRGTALRFGEEAELEALFVKVAPRREVIVDAGKILSPVGAFTPRRLSTVNPLIDRPDTYGDAYPNGVQVSGVIRWLDYRVAAVDLPVTHESYLPAPGRAFRPVLGAGIAPLPDVHLGVSYTTGPYLHESVTQFLPAGSALRDHRQSVLSFDGRLARGYADLHTEVVFSSYDVPTRGRVTGMAYYAELKYVWTPRLFTAMRLQRNRYPFIRPPSATRPAWRATESVFIAGEFGIGFRIGRGTLAKVSLMQDAWEGTDPDGRAVAVQLSHHFDVVEWVQGRR